MIDITEQKKNKSELEKQKLFLSSIIDAIPDAIFIKDKDSHYIGCNNAFAEMIAKTPKDEVFGKTDFDFFKDKVRADENILQDKYIMDTKASRTNYVLMDTLYGKKSFETIKTPLYDEIGDVLGIIGIARDITLRKLMEEELKKSELKFRLLFENMTNCFSVHEVILDENSTPTDFKFLLVNKAYEEQMKERAEDIIGKSMLEIHKNASRKMIVKFCEVGMTGEPLHLEYYSDYFGRYFNTFTFSPQKGLFATVFEDVTERKEIEFALKASEERFKQLAEIFP